MTTTERQPIPEVGEYLISNRNLLQKTAREQDLLDGGTKIVYFFDLQDTIDLAWEEGTRPNKDIRHLFKDTH